MGPFVTLVFAVLWADVTHLDALCRQAAHPIMMSCGTCQSRASPAHHAAAFAVRTALLTYWALMCAANTLKEFQLSDRGQALVALLPIVKKPPASALQFVDCCVALDVQHHS